MASPSSAVLGGIRSGELVATAMVGDDGHRGWVYYLAVSEKCRRHGIGRSMMAACETWLRARKAPKVRLMVRLDNQDVAAFYKNIGYQTEEFVLLSKSLDSAL